MPRIISTSRGVVLGVLTAAALLAACTPPLPPDVLAAKTENEITCRSGTLTVRVPEDFTGAMDAVGQALTGVCAKQVTAEVTDQGNGPVRLVDQAPTDAQRAEFAAGACPRGSTVVVPAFSYVVALAYNVVGLEGLVLTPQAIAGILDGSVTSWEDPLITEPNGDYDLSGLPAIRVLGAEHDPGSVTAMTSWLTYEDPSAWSAGVVGTVPAATTYPTHNDLVDALLVNEGAVAVLPAFLAVAGGIPVASVPVQGTVVAPDDTQLAKVGAGATTVTVDGVRDISASPAIGGVPTAENFDLTASKVVLADGQPLLGWPIMGYAHLLLCDAPDTALPTSFAQYVLRLAGQGALETYGVTPLPEPVRVGALAALTAVADSGAVGTR